MKPTTKMPRAIPVAEHEQIVAELQQTIAGYDAHRQDQAKAIEEARQRNGVLAAQIQKLMFDLERATAALAEKSREVEEVRRIATEATRDFCEARAESVHLRHELASARDAVAEAMIMLAEARSDDRAARIRSARRRESADATASNVVRI